MYIDSSRSGRLRWLPYTYRDPNGELRRSDATAASSETLVSAESRIKRVALTGATGFVGRAVLRELVVRGYDPVCLVRSHRRADAVMQQFIDRPSLVVGTLFDDRAVREMLADVDAVIHLVGIIFEHRFGGQTFERIHRDGTACVVRAAQELGVRRFIHMSALGARPNAISRYHQTKYQAEQVVHLGGLDSTIFRPSLIHGPDGEFMQLMARFVRKMVPPVIPYFGSGEALLQPISVKDVATLMVGALSRPATIGQVFSAGGPDVYSWKAFYAACQRGIPRARGWKPIVGLPVPLAMLLARTVMRTPLVPAALRFNVDQVAMSQEDSTCDLTPLRLAFDLPLRHFEDELRTYGDLLA